MRGDWDIHKHRGMGNAACGDVEGQRNGEKQEERGIDFPAIPPDDG